MGFPSNGTFFWGVGLMGHQNNRMAPMFVLAGFLCFLFCERDQLVFVAGCLLFGWMALRERIFAGGIFFKVFLWLKFVYLLNSLQVRVRILFFFIYLFIYLFLYMLLVVLPLCWHKTRHFYGLILI